MASVRTQIRNYFYSNQRIRHEGLTAVKIYNVPKLYHRVVWQVFTKIPQKLDTSFFKVDVNFGV